MTKIFTKPLHLFIPYLSLRYIIVETEIIDTLRKYLSYAKKIDPKLTKDATDVIKEFYMKMRTIESEALTVTPRQLEGLVRIATAHARLLLKDVVDKEDAERAIFLVMKSLDSIGIDIETGVVKQIGKLSKKDLFMSMFTEPRTESELIELLKDRFSETEVKSYIQKASKSGEIIEPSQGLYTK